MNVDSQPSFSTAVPWRRGQNGHGKTGWLQISGVLELMDTSIVSYCLNIVCWSVVYCMVLYDICVVLLFYLSAYENATCQSLCTHLKTQTAIPVDRVCFNPSMTQCMWATVTVFPSFHISTIPVETQIHLRWIYYGTLSDMDRPECHGISHCFSIYTNLRLQQPSPGSKKQITVGSTPKQGHGTRATPPVFWRGDVHGTLMPRDARGVIPRAVICNYHQQPSTTFNNIQKS